MRCKNCGLENARPARYCSACGEKLGGGRILSPKLIQSLPLIGGGLALVGFCLPWLNILFVGVSGGSLAGMVSRTFPTGLDDMIWGFIEPVVRSANLLNAVLIWMLPALAVLSAAYLLRSTAGRIVTLVSAATGLGVLITLHVRVIENYLRFLSGVTTLSYGYILTWIGFCVMLGGTIAAWVWESKR